MLLNLLFFVEIYLDGEQWNDGLLATVREQVWLFDCYLPFLLMFWYLSLMFSIVITCLNFIVDVHDYDNV